MAAAVREAMQAARELIRARENFGRVIALWAADEFGKPAGPRVTAAGAGVSELGAGGPAWMGSMRRPEHVGAEIELASGRTLRIPRAVVLPPNDEPSGVSCWDARLGVGATAVLRIASSFTAAWTPARGAQEEAALRADADAAAATAAAGRGRARRNSPSAQQQQQQRRRASDEGAE